MNVVNVPVQPPGICFICEAVNGPTYLDTFRHFDPAGPTKLTGRKYVCEGCVREFAAYYGYCTPSEKDDLLAEVGRLQGLLQTAEAQLGSRDHFVNAVRRLEEVGLFEKPRAKPGPRRSKETSAHLPAEGVAKPKVKDGV